MLADPKSQAFVENFSGQWLQTRAILDIPINSAEVLAQEASSPSAPMRPRRIQHGRGGGRGGSGCRSGAGFPRGFRRGGRGAVYTGTELTPEVRNAMKQEVDAYFGYVMREDRSVLELLKSNYTFVNAALGRSMALPTSTAWKCAKSSLQKAIRGAEC